MRKQFKLLYFSLVYRMSFFGKFAQSGHPDHEPKISDCESLSYYLVTAGSSHTLTVHSVQGDQTSL
jgi:hypothetical protein